MCTFGDRFWSWCEIEFGALTDRDRVRQLPVWHRLCAVVALLCLFILLFSVLWKGVPSGFPEIPALFFLVAYAFFQVIFYSSEQATECLLRLRRTSDSARTDPV